MHSLVQVNGVFTGHDIVQSGSLLGGLGVSDASLHLHTVARGMGPGGHVETGSGAGPPRLRCSPLRIHL